jgi:hypothetical protein
MTDMSPSIPPSWPIRRVFQKHDHGCGIACVAMLAGCSYDEARVAIFGDTAIDATSLEDLQLALSYFGLQPADRAIPFWEARYNQLSQPALLITNPDQHGNWHATVWDPGRRRILDPLKASGRSQVVVGHLAIGGVTKPHPTECRPGRSGLGRSVPSGGTAKNAAISMFMARASRSSTSIVGLNVCRSIPLT